MSVLDTLTEKQKTDLVELALRSGQELSYCDETRNVLEQMGFTVEDQQIRVKLIVDVTVPPGTDVDDYLAWSVGFNDGDTDVFADSVAVDESYTL